MGLPPKAMVCGVKLVLTVILNGQPFERIEVEKFRRLRIGRAEECELRLDNPAVSAYHCEILSRDDLLRLYDLDSANQTLLNSVAITDHSLNHGDVISIGKFTIDVEIDGAARGSQRADRADRAPTGDMTIDGDVEGLVEAQAEAEHRVRGYLTFPRTDGPPLVLEEHYVRFGRDPEAEIQLGFWSPRLAAVLVREEFGFRLIDLSPRGNAVRVNGTRVEDIRLSHNDRVRIRSLEAVFNQGAPSDL